MQKRQRLTREQRREQILEVALQTVAQRGVRGATLTSIAAGVGITYPALYAYFPTRRDLLLALIDQLFHRIRDVFACAHREDPIEHLREIGRANSRLVAEGETGYVLPFFEFVAADPEEHLREVFGERVLTMVDELTEIAQRGRREGSIAEDADPEQIAWMVMGCGWTDDIAALMGLDDRWTAARSQEMVDWILGSATVAPSPHSGGG